MMTQQHSRGPGAAATGAAYRLFFGKFPVFRSASIYAGVATLGTALFFFLHYLGNSIPYDLAKQRFTAEFESNRLDEGHALGFKSRFEYCHISLAVMAGARKIDSENSLVETVILKVFKAESPDPDYCGRLKAASSGVDLDKGGLKTRYWWGSKALYAIALRHLSVFEIRELTRISTYLAYGLLAVSLLLLSPRMLLIATPLIMFGAFFSGIRYWADVANGTPYLWTVLSAAVLALLMRGRPSRWASPEAVRLYCFAAGMMSSYLWLGDGHTFLAITWFGLVVWFGHGDLDAPERTRRAVSCIALYLSGFAICYALGQLVKFIVLGSGVWWNFWSQVVVVFDRTVSQDRVQSLEKILRSFYEMAVGTNETAGGVLTALSVLALAGSVSLAAFRAHKGRFDPLRGILWIVGLLLINVPQFAIAEDIPYRTARFMFVPHALCLSCLVLVAWKTEQTFFTILIGVPLLGLVFVQLHFYFGVENTTIGNKMIGNDQVDKLIEADRPVIRSDFDVYVDENGNRLIYVREECSDADIGPKFFLHLVPVDRADLPDHRQQYRFDNLDFSFNEDGFVDAGRCVAVRQLPDYPIASIRTGQYTPGKGQIWAGEFRPGQTK